MYNFASLSNLPDILELYGSVHGLWEGSFRGEAIISKAKSEIKHAFRGRSRHNAAFNLCHRVAKNMSLYRMEESWKQTINEDLVSNKSNNDDQASIGSNEMDVSGNHSESTVLTDQESDIDDDSVDPDERDKPQVCIIPASADGASCQIFDEDLNFKIPGEGLSLRISYRNHLIIQQQSPIIMRSHCH
jgi:hypothetical protein